MRRGYDAILQGLSAVKAALDPQSASGCAQPIPLGARLRRARFWWLWLAKLFTKTDQPPRLRQLRARPSSAREARTDELPHDVQRAAAAAAAAAASDCEKSAAPRCKRTLPARSAGDFGRAQKGPWTLSGEGACRVADLVHAHELGVGPQRERDADHERHMSAMVGSSIGAGALRGRFRRFELPSHA